MPTRIRFIASKTEESRLQPEFRTSNGCSLAIAAKPHSEELSSPGSLMATRSSGPRQEAVLSAEKRDAQERNHDCAKAENCAVGRAPASPVSTGPGGKKREVD